MNESSDIFQDLEIYPEMELHSTSWNFNPRGTFQISKEPSSVSPVFFPQIRETPMRFEEHEALLENRELFNEKLQKFHRSSGKRLTVNVGAMALDLYILYKEVTARGGLVGVIKDGRWEEVASALNLSSRIPNPSFPLRKHYIDLLYHFEQVYFFRVQGEPAAPPGPLPAPGQAKKIVPIYGYCSTVKRKRPNYSLLSSSVDPGAYVGSIVTGAIKTKFDGGYLITVMVGSEKLNGLLYHVQGCAVEQFAVIPGLMGGFGSNSKDEPVGLQIHVSPAKRKSNMGSMTEAMKKDPDAPKRPTTAFLIFCSEERDRLKKINPGQEGNMRKMVTEAWKCLSETDRMPYFEQSKRDKERYEQEMTAYRERQNPQVIKAKEQLEEELEYRPYYPEKGDEAYYVTLGNEPEFSEFPMPDSSMDPAITDHFFTVPWMNDVDLPDSFYAGWDMS